MGINVQVINIICCHCCCCCCCCSLANIILTDVQLAPPLLVTKHSSLIQPSPESTTYNITTGCQALLPFWQWPTRIRTGCGSPTCSILTELGIIQSIATLVSLFIQGYPNFLPQQVLYVCTPKYIHLYTYTFIYIYILYIIVLITWVRVWYGEIFHEWNIVTGHVISLWRYLGWNKYTYTSVYMYRLHYNEEVGMGLTQPRAEEPRIV